MCLKTGKWITILAKQRKINVVQHVKRVLRYKQNFTRKERFILANIPNEKIVEIAANVYRFPFHLKRLNWRLFKY